MREHGVCTAMVAAWLAVCAATISQEVRSAPPERHAVPAGYASAARARPRRATSALDTRIAAYTRILHLDAQQQGQLRTLLLHERAEMQRVWRNTELPASERVLRTRAIGDATADRIRAMLNPEQLKKYNPPRVSPKAPSEPISVEDWMNATSAR